jgi:very-short-patch-repair endonuclease
MENDQKPRTYYKHPRTPRHLVAHARRMRKNPTPAEAKLWRVLRGKQLGVKFRRQQPIDRHIVDFCCFTCDLIVEVDGDVHAFQVEQDRHRQAELEALGYTVLRFTNEQVLKEFDAVVGEIVRCCEQSPSL